MSINLITGYDINRDEAGSVYIKSRSAISIVKVDEQVIKALSLNKELKNINKMYF